MSRITITEVVSQVENCLLVPAIIDDSQFPPLVLKRLCVDISILSCGCLISEDLFRQISPSQFSIKCPTCKKENVNLISPCNNMRVLSSYLLNLKKELREDESSTMSSIGSNPKLQKGKKGATNLSFLTAFHEALTEVNNSSSFEENNENLQSFSFNGKYSPQNSYNNKSDTFSRFSDEIVDPNINNTTAHSPTSNSIVSSLCSIQKQRTKQSLQSSNLTKLLSTSPTIEKTNMSKRKETNKEHLLAKNFPFFRRLYTHNIHHTNFLLKSRLSIQTDLSPKLTKFVLLGEKKWDVFSVDTEKPDKQPQLVCSGKNDASYGTNPENFKRMTKDQIVSNSNFIENLTESLNLLEKWEHLSCKITENLLVISGTRGFLRILDLTQNGRCLYTYQCKFPIRCIDVSPNEEYIALGVTGKDKYTQVEQAVIILIKLYPAAGDSPFQISTHPFTLPYRDPINILKFSPSSNLLSVATALESRFLVISVTDPSKPSMVMKSQRRLDTSLDSEGITDIGFFPDESLMTLTSVSYNSAPIIIDTNITSISGPEGIAKPKLLMKVDEVGSTVHKCCISPRGDSVAYLNRNGTVYLMTAPRMDDNDNKRVVIVTDVANAFRAKEAAAMRFDPDGYKLYVLDRKGALVIADFTAGTVEDHFVTRCKIII